MCKDCTAVSSSDSERRLNQIRTAIVIPEMKLVLCCSSPLETSTCAKQVSAHAYNLRHQCLVVCRVRDYIDGVVAQQRRARARSEGTPAGRASRDAHVERRSHHSTTQQRYQRYQWLRPQSPPLPIERHAITTAATRHSSCPERG